MRIQFASDLHLEYLNRRFPDYVRVSRLGRAQADLLILAGDIHVDTHMFEKFGQWDIPVVYVPGNHEFYDAAKVLFRDEWIFGGVRFLGCTLWTDYELMGTGVRQRASMLACEARIADHRTIMGVEKTGQGFSAQQALALHQCDRLWLASKLDEPFVGKTVVVTHHAPSRGSMHPRFRGDPCNPAFISNLDNLGNKL